MILPAAYQYYYIYTAIVKSIHNNHLKKYGEAEKMSLRRKKSVL